MKTITYADILELYKASDRNYLCHVLTRKYPGFDTDEFLKAIGIDAYGPILGRLTYWYKTKVWSWSVLTLIYSHLGFFLKLPRSLKRQVFISHQDERRVFRMAVLEALAKKCPEREFRIP